MKTARTTTSPEPVASADDVLILAGEQENQDVIDGVGRAAAP